MARAAMGTATGVASDGFNRVALFLVLLACYAYFPPRWADWNQNSRVDLTLAIVESATIRIDDYYENTGDYAVFGGHKYTDKAPGLSLVAVPVYSAFRVLARSSAARNLLDRVSHTEALGETLRPEGTGVRSDKVYFAAALYAVTFAGVSVPSALLGVLLYSFLAPLLPSAAARFRLLLAYGLATVAFPYSTVFYGHQTAAVLLFAAFERLHGIRWGTLGEGWLWTAGALCGLAVLIEFPALVPLLLLSLYAWRSVRRPLGLVRIVLGGAPFALALGWYNHSAFGSPFASSYRYLAIFPEISATGILGFSWPDAKALWGISFSPYRGLFFLSPFLLLAAPGFSHVLRDPAWRREGLLWLSIAVVQLALVSAWYDWRGGFAIGPRNLLVCLPFLIPPIAACMQAWSGRAWLRRSASALMILSFALVWVASVSGQSFPPIDVANPLTDFFWPKLLRGDVTRNLGMAIGLSSWYSLLPVLTAIGATLALVHRREGVT
jgi:hypothetical protein